jgi:hypothetical protein
MDKQDAMTHLLIRIQGAGLGLLSLYSAISVQISAPDIRQTQRKTLLFEVQ